MSSTTTKAASASTSSFVTSLATNFAIAGGELVAWILLRRYIKAIYEPRTYIPPRDNQAQPMSKHPLKPLWQILKASPEEVLEKNGVDPYVYLRFLIMMVKIMVPIWALSWAILLPADAVKSQVNGKTGLDKLTFGNVASTKQDRYWAHLILNYIFVFWILVNVWREMRNWLVIRQKHLINPAHSKLAQANTVLVTGIPEDFLDEHKLAGLFSYLPGGVKRIWLVRNLKEMPGLYERRLKAVNQLESSQVKLIKFARAYKEEREKKSGKMEKKNKTVPDTLSGPMNPQLLKQGSDGKVNGSANAEEGRVFTSVEELGLADQLVPRSKRPTTRLKPKWAPFGLGFLAIGKKVDAIDWAREEIVKTTEELQISREQLKKDIESIGIAEDKYPPLNSAFIHFNQQIAAHMAAQCLDHHRPYAMQSRYIEQSPKNVIWGNLSMGPYEKNIRTAISWGATFGLMVLWTTPVAFIGVLSNVTTLTTEYHWLAWINGDGFGYTILQGVISGVLPPILLGILMEIIIGVLRSLSAFEGHPSKTEVEFNLMTRYFIFLVFHTFFVVTLASGLISAVQEFANNPGSVATTLAAQMPTASTFFITLILAQFTGTMGTLLRIVKLLLYYVRVIATGGTPRSVFTSRYKMNVANMGEWFPKITVYAVIVIAYSVISPVINGFGACFFIFAVFVYKYVFIWCIDVDPAADTGGMFFPKAITHVFVGLYVQEVCMCALFFLARNQDGNASSVAQGALMVVLIVATAASHYTIFVSYKPLRNALPLSLAHLSYGMPGLKDRTQAFHNYSLNDDPENPLELQTSRDPLTAGVVKATNLIPSKLRIDTKIGDKFKQKNALSSTSDREYGVSPRVVERPSDDVTLAERDFAQQPGGAGAISREEEQMTRGEEVELQERWSGEEGDLSQVPRNVEGLENGHPDEEPTPASATSPGRPIPRPPSPSDSIASVESTKYFALPGGPGLISRQVDDGNDPNAFFHPATQDPQRVIWLPQDELGLGQAEVAQNKRDGVKSSYRNARLDTKNKVQIYGPPPDDL
ncbi:hypothetical protein L202_07996 [Cryptococcus amylolentus CBS 6039]|uniref:CSC1/OSCA1-like 7TM region domain-containing protein n=1 Tax=Cryptococcus amylolentus CBS 6039 TaxID=1295533 RepID=A0A1E3HDG5_9TREE|nr:hypothetical protein L202_07996 [Cryptococcus amylolentus CBS 6039]ODN73491.1 hypothetical protein L202_07996 [Cryptococcus amylolentus CBS 6039]